MCFVGQLVVGHLLIMCPLCHGVGAGWRGEGERREGGREKRKMGLVFLGSKKGHFGNCGSQLCLLPLAPAVADLEGWGEVTECWQRPMLY